MDRKNRIKLLKRIIVGTIVTMVLLPTVLCIILFVKTQCLKSSLVDLINQIIAYEGEIRSLNTELKEQQFEVEKLTSSLNQHIEEQSNVAPASVESGEFINEETWPKKVYLTFDDGPSGHTEEILNILDEYEVKGNFFVCHTSNEDYLKYYNMILERGHMLGIHSYSHVYDDIYSSQSAFEEDVSSIRDFVFDQTGGYLAKYYRFPGGSSNLVDRLSISSCIDYLNSQGLTYFDWNISTQDATNPMQETGVIFKNATLNADKYEEVMILMHDLGNKDSTVEALPQIIEFYQELGAEISIINEDTKLIH